MNNWTDDELTKIGETDELYIASQKQDGSLRDAVIIWVVRVGNDVFVRSVKGTNGKWYQHALVQHKGHIEAGGVSKDVTFSEIKSEHQDEIDKAYQTKYAKYGATVDSTLTPQAQVATLKIVPQ